MLGTWPKIDYEGIIDSSVAHVLKKPMFMKDSIIHAKVQNMYLISNGMMINCNLLKEIFARPFITWTCENECSNYIPIDTFSISLGLEI